MSKIENTSYDAVSGSTSRSDSQESLKLEDCETLVQVDCTLFYKGDRAQHLRREVEDELPNSMNLFDVLKTMAAKSSTLKRENEVIGRLYLVTTTRRQKHYSQLDFELFENKQLCHLGHGDVRLVYDTCGHLHTKKLLKSSESGKWTIEKSGRSTLTSSMIGTVEDQPWDEQNIKDKTILLLSEAVVRKDQRIESLEEVVREMKATMEEMEKKMNKEKENVKITPPSVPELSSSATPTSTPAAPIYNFHITGNQTIYIGQPVSSHDDRQTTGTSDAPPPDTSSTIASSAKDPPPSAAVNDASSMELSKRIEDTEARLKTLDEDSDDEEDEMEEQDDKTDAAPSVSHKDPEQFMVNRAKIFINCDFRTYQSAVTSDGTAVAIGRSGFIKINHKTNIEQRDDDGEDESAKAAAPAATKFQYEKAATYQKTYAGGKKFNK